MILVHTTGAGYFDVDVYATVAGSVVVGVDSVVASVSVGVVVSVSVGISVVAGVSVGAVVSVDVDVSVVAGVIVNYC